MTTMERVLYPERAAAQTMRETRHRQAIEAVKECGGYFQLQLQDSQAEEILVKTGEELWIADGQSL